MPKWRGPAYRGEFPSLGWLVGEWIEANCVVPDGELAGQPFLLTREMWEFLVWHYRLKLSATPERWKSAWAYRRSQLVRPQKWGKGPFAAAMICAEAVGPVLFAGWDSDGEPMGRPWEPSSVWIQVTAQSEGQTDNVWRALQPMIEMGPLADEIPDTGLTRINIPGGGKIHVVTASAGARLGQRITFVVQDEVHSWVEARGGVTLADTQRRNLSGTGGRALETTNAWDPSERSVAQLTAETKVRDVYRSHPKPPSTLSIHNKRERRKALRLVYGDSNVERGGWVDLDRIDGEIEEMIARDPAQAERFYLNRDIPGASQWIKPEHWALQKRELLQLSPGDAITLGFDGSIGDDNTALVACRVSDGLIVPIHVWKRPKGVDGQEWEVDPAEVTQMVDEQFATYRVVLMHADPHEWRSTVGTWSKDHGDGDNERVREFPTNSLTRMGPCLDLFRTDVMQHKLLHNGDPTLDEHIDNARTSKRGKWTVIGKETEKSPKKIDCAVAAALAYDARSFVLDHPELMAPKKYYAYTA